MISHGIVSAHRYSDPHTASYGPTTDARCARVFYVRCGVGTVRFGSQSQEVKSSYVVTVQHGQDHAIAFRDCEPVDVFLLRFRFSEPGSMPTDLPQMVHAPQSQQEPLLHLFEEAAVTCARGQEVRADLAARLLVRMRAVAVGNRVLFAARHLGRSPRDTGRHAHPSEYQIDYFHGGAGRLWLRDSWKEIRRGDLFLVPPGTEHEIIYDPAVAFDNYSIKLNLSRSNRLGDEASRLAVAPADREPLAGILRTIVGTYVMDGAVGDETVERLIDEVLRLRERATEMPRSGVDRIARVREIIESNYALPLTLDWVARKVALRPEYLSRLFKKVCGANLSTYLREVRLEAGRKLIETTDLAVTRVARDCGFGDVYYFSASFRRRFGESPSAARRRRSMPAQKAEAVSARP